MAGIYVHIPFCRKACYYCDFHFSTSLKTKENVLSGIRIEALQRKESLADQEVQTIYLGGGTPSLLSSGEIEDILTAIYKHYQISPEPEITLEANPEDIKEDKIEICIRAIDSNCNTQPEKIDALWNIRGLLNNSWHRIELLVTRQ